MEGPLAVVTGAASGIGRATCARLVEAGCRVLAVDRDGGGLASLESPAVRIRVTDVADTIERASLVDAVRAEGTLTYLVNAAGILRPRPLTELTPEDVRTVMAVNLEGPLFLSLALVDTFGAGGAIVNVSSSAAKLGATTELAAYAASKAALVSVTRAIAFAYAGRGLRANAVCPGIIETPMDVELRRAVAEARNMPDADVLGQRLASIPMRRAGQPDDVAELIWFLLSPAAAFMTAQAVNITGGQVWW